MTDKYIKTSSKSRKLVIYGAICFFVVAVNTVTLIYGIFSHSGEEYGGWLITPIAGFLINCFSILYCILQDIRQTCQKPQPHFVFQNKHDIPFVDREDLIEEVATQKTKKVYLGHLSKENNYEKLAYETVKISLHNFTLPIEVARRDTVSTVTSVS